MKSFRLCLVIPFVASVLIAGCTTSTPTVSSTGGSFTVTKSGTTGFTPIGVLRKEAYKEAVKYADSQGMVAEIISVNETPAGFARWPQVDLRFRLVSASSRNAKEIPSTKIESHFGNDAKGNPTHSETVITGPSEFDFYGELKKLGELKEKGLLTEEEFQKEKKRLMELRK